MHLADLASYVATQSRVSDLYADRQAWGRKAILNVARSGKFSSDRTIAEYAESIWGAKPLLRGPSRGIPGAVGAVVSRSPSTDRRPASEETHQMVPKWLSRSSGLCGGSRRGRSSRRSRSRAAPPRSGRRGRRRPRWCPSSRPAG